VRGAEGARPAIAHGDADPVADVVLGVAGDVDAVTAALGSLIGLVSHAADGRRKARAWPSSRVALPRFGARWARVPTISGVDGIPPSSPGACQGTSCAADPAPAGG